MTMTAREQQSQQRLNVRREGFIARSKRKVRLLAIIRLAAAAVLLIPAPQSSSIAQTMTLPGKFAVGASGAATYTIPIAVPPGTAGMSPSLSLEYNSQSGASGGWLGNGVVGTGWTLGGLPALGRCPRTLAQDGVAGGVNYDANDRFCLEGQRLMAINNGAYGADGTEYRTEIESFSRVISHGTAGTGPAWFEVRTKSGQILEFGNTTDSRILAEGKTTARSWGVNKVGDTNGNYYTVTYVNDTVNGQAYPSRVDYTGNAAASLAPYSSVQFVYDTNRPDVVPIYHAGSLMKTTVRLSKVQTYAGTTLVSDYRLAYQQGTTTGRSQLTSVTLCDGASNCLPETTFTWQNGTLTPTVISNVAGQNGTVYNHRPYLGDFNGDGLPDILWNEETQSPPASSGTRVLWTNTGGGNFAVTSNLAGQDWNLAGHTPIVVDINRDGRADILWYAAGTGAIDGLTYAQGATKKWMGTPGGGFAISDGPSLDGLLAPVAFMVGDLNSDNRADFMWLNYSSSPLSATVWLMNANGSVSSNSVLAPNVAPPYLPGMAYPATYYTSFSRGADFDGDGKGDLLWITQNFGMTALWLGNGDGTFRQAAGTDISVNGYNPYFVDVNGDGKTDVFWDRGDGQRILWISKGDGTFVVVSNPGGANGTLLGISNFGDFNGDGLADILWDKQDGTRLLWLGKGDGMFTVVSNAGGQNGTLVDAVYTPLLVDFNGDGKTDVMWMMPPVFGGIAGPTDWFKRVLWLSDGAPADLVTTVTTGVGAITAITYKPLTDGSVYSKDTTAVDPDIDVQMPLQVVSQVDASNGIGGSVAMGYAYAGAKSNHNGRGFLGFRQMKVTDLQTNIVQTTTYRQDYPYLSLVASEAQTLSAATLSATTNTHGATALGGTRYQVFLSQSQASKVDLDGTALPTATSTFQYDGYNNATQVMVATSDGYTKTTTNTYTNDTTNWLLGRLTGATVTSQAPQQLGQYCALPWGGTITSGQSVTAYSATSVPVGQSCAAVAQSRACVKGTLTGSFANQSCAAMCALPWGGSISSGQSVTAYSATSVPAGQNCASVAQTRTCTDGTLSGSYTSQVCVASGSIAYTIAGTYTFTVPSFNTLSIDVKGGGGAGGFYGGLGLPPGWTFYITESGQSSFNGNVVAYGGGISSYRYDEVYEADVGVNGTPGTASGGSTNTTGGGAAGGPSNTFPDTYGGAGGRAQRTYSAGQLTPGTQITVVVGAAGQWAGTYGQYYTSYTGQPGSVSISWQ